MDRPPPKAATNTGPAAPKARRRWQPDPRNVKAMDRFIAQTYGREWVRRSRGDS